jgi:mannose-6-phosphate isomerase-like protein (cupin superfamily)
LAADASFKLDLYDAIERLGASAKPFEVRLQHGDFTLEFFSPREEDTQQPHEQDEVYIIARGAALFRCRGDTVQVEAGDALYVPARDEHRFEKFSDDFATWVIFFGPKKPA